MTVVTEERISTDELQEFVDGSFEELEFLTVDNPTEWDTAATPPKAIGTIVGTIVLHC